MAKELKDLYEEHEKFNSRQRKRIIDAAKGELADVQDLISSYANKDGTIDRRKLNRLIRELDDIEKDMRDDIMDELEEYAEDTAEWSAKKVATVVGITASAAYISRMKKRVKKDVINRKGEDDLKLKDRVWSISGNIRDEIAKTIRHDVLRGKSATEIIPKIRKKYDGETWKLERLIRTEGPTAFRAVIMENARKDGKPGWVRFHEGTCGRPDHYTHNCYDLQREDRHGAGKGIFKTSDTDILTPHPNCTSWITFLDDEGREL